MDATSPAVDSEWGGSRGEPLGALVAVRQCRVPPEAVLPRLPIFARGPHPASARGAVSFRAVKSLLGEPAYGMRRVRTLRRADGRRRPGAAVGPVRSPDLSTLQLLSRRPHLGGGGSCPHAGRPG